MAATPPRLASGRDPAGQTASDVLALADQAAVAGLSFVSAVSPTGFTPLDDYLGGGLRNGELTLLGGAQGLGKTVFALQIARNVAAAGGNATFVSYEHDVTQVLERLLAMELGLTLPYDAPTRDEVRLALSRNVSSGSLSERLGDTSAAALDAVRSYGDRLRLVRASGARTGVEHLGELVEATADGTRPLLVVDYLQKVCSSGVPGGEGERVTHVVEGLKDLALDNEIPVLAVVAADKEGVSGGRTRLHHLRGSTALAYEADIALLLNEKYDVIARHHLMYGTADTDRYRDWVVCSLEKNRNGVADVDLEFRKEFAHARFDPCGRPVAETLADPRLGHE